MPDQNPEQKTVLVIETEVYSRVVGYFRPVSGWNLGKKQEFEDRKPVMAETPKKEISP
jgi:anaerobic ribonucleoside-triphosphate reductase